MEKILVEGGYRLKGDIKISGSKNAALPILISALLADGESTFLNVPRLDDIFNTISLLRSLGVVIKFEGNTIKINPLGLNSYEAPYELVHKMRASILILGPLIVRFKKARVSLPGGCSIGERPIDLHLRALEQLGVKIKLTSDYVNASTNKLIGNNIHFKIVTVTGTENIIMASVLASGITFITNSACEPEIIALSNVLNKMGAKIYGAGSYKIMIVGVDKLSPVRYSIIPDRIEAGTFMVASALTQGNINIINCIPENLNSIIDNIKLIGATVKIKGNNIRVIGVDDIASIDFKTLPYPGFPTDLQAPFMVLMSISKGLSIVSETIFENRFFHARELNRMGANIIINGNNAIIRGVKSLYGTAVIATDLRAAASLVLAGLVAKGKTEIGGVNHLDRGYESLDKKIKYLGGNIKRIEI